jgi:hypothetical protein
MRLYPFTHTEPMRFSWRAPVSSGAEQLEHAGMMGAINFPIGMARAVWDEGLRPLGRDIEAVGTRLFPQRYPMAPNRVVQRRGYAQLYPGTTGNWADIVRSRINRTAQRYPVVGRAITKMNAGPRTFGQALGYNMMRPLVWGGRQVLRGGLGLGGAAVRAAPPTALGAGAAVGFGIGMGVGVARFAANQAANIITEGAGIAGSPAGRFIFGSTPAGFLWRGAGLTAAVAAVTGAQEGFMRTWRRDDRRSPATRNFQNSTYGLPLALAS